MNQTYRGIGKTAALGSLGPILEHYWNTDSCKVWSPLELAEASDTSALRPLLEEGHRPVPGWEGFSCDTQRVLGGTLFRLFTHNGLSAKTPNQFGPESVTIDAPGIPKGTLYAVVGIGPDKRSADVMWQCMRVESAALYAAHHSGWGTLCGKPVADYFHGPQGPRKPTGTPWFSLIAYDPVLNDNLLCFPHGETLILWLAKEWLSAASAGHNENIESQEERQ